MLFKVKKIVVLMGLFVSSTNVCGMLEDRGNYGYIRRSISMPELRYLGNFHGGDISCDRTCSDLRGYESQSKEDTDNIIEESYTDEGTTGKVITDDFSKNESDSGASDEKIDDLEVYNEIIKLYTGKYSGINPVEKDQEDMSAEKGLKNDPSVENPGSTPRIKDHEDTSARKGLENTPGIKYHEDTSAGKGLENDPSVENPGSTPRIKDHEDTSAEKGLENDPSVENPGSTPRIKDHEDTSAGKGLENDPILSKRVTTINKQSKNNENSDQKMNQHRQNLSTEAKKIEGQRVDQQKKKQVQEKLRNKRFRRKLPNFLKNTETFLKKVITKIFER